MKRTLVTLLTVLPLSGCVFTPTVTTSPTSSATAELHVRARKDLTPGVLNSDVTQANIRSTICKTGWTRTIRPPVAYTEKLKRQGIIAYGWRDHTLSHYEEDHLVPLELGGAPSDPRNLWPEPGASPNQKDGEESSLRAGVCRGRLTLAAAQAKILADWGGA